MDKKTHGPAFVRRRISLTDCPSCAGRGLVKGVFHQLDCIGCHASGLVHAETLEPLPVDADPPRAAPCAIAVGSADHRRPVPASQHSRAWWFGL